MGQSSPPVILSAAKDLLRQAGRAPGPQILRCAQDDRLALSILVVTGHQRVHPGVQTAAIDDDERPGPAILVCHASLRSASACPSDSRVEAGDASLRSA